MTRTMPPRTEYYYRQFASRLGGPFAYHPTDMKRFYEFTWAAAIGRSSLSGADVQARLLADGASTGDAERLSDIYDTCRTFANARLSLNLLSWRPVRRSEGILLKGDADA